MIVALDTSTDRLSLALWDPESGVREQCQVLCERRHGETLMPALAGLLAGQQLTPKDITGVAVGVGPGSFTGVRVGLATGMGLAQARHLPIAGISSYLAVAAAAQAERVLVVGDARRGRLYAAAYHFRSGQTTRLISEDVFLPRNLLAQLPQGAWKLSGPAAHEFYELLRQLRPDLELAPAELHLPQAQWLARLAIPVLDGGGTPLEQIAPLYLQRAQAETALR